MTSAAEYDATLRERFPDLTIAASDELDMPTIVVPGERIVAVLEFLRDEFGFTMLMDLSACDWLGREPRYHVNYHLYSMDSNVRVRVKVQLPDVPEPHVPSAVPAFAAADWHEREVFDFFGIVFDGHPELTRILLPDDWEGYPLRKDEPLGGVPTWFHGATVPPIDERGMA